MTSHYCPQCPKILSSIKVYNSHLSLAHDCYKDGIWVEEAAIKSLEKVKERVLFLMRRYSGCRNPDNGELFTRYKQYWLGHIYDAKTKMHDATPYAADIWMNRQLETVRRRAQEHRSRERKLRDAGLPYDNILPTEEHEHLADVREKTYRRYFSDPYLNEQGANIVVNGTGADL